MFFRLIPLAPLFKTDEGGGISELFELWCAEAPRHHGEEIDMPAVVRVRLMLRGDIEDWRVDNRLKREDRALA